MSELKKLQDEFNEKKEHLQSTCLHPTISDWVQEYWAFGHATKYLTQYCKICGKTVHRGTECFKCHKELLDSDILEGDGQILPIGASYCKECGGK